MNGKRKRDDDRTARPTNVVAKPAAGTRSFTSGQAVKAGLGAGNSQSLVAFHQQILTLHSELPLAIAHPSVVIIQHYLDVSPTCEEVFAAWQDGDKRRDDELVCAAVALLAQIIRILTPLPFFRNLLVGVLDKLLAPQERYHDHLSRMINSANRESTLAGLNLAAAAIHVDKPDPSSGFTDSGGRLSLRLWAYLVEGGVVKNLGKLLIMRKRRKDGTADYGKKDPLDRPDMRHLCLEIISPLFCSPAFHSHTRQIMKAVYTQFEQDPPVTIYRLLTSLWQAITAPSAGAGRKVALALLDERAIDSILALFSREEAEPTTGKSIADIAAAFLAGVTTDPGRGVCFTDEGWYPRKQAEGKIAMNELDDNQVFGTAEEKHRRGLHNRILSNVVRRLGSKVVDDNGRIGQWAVKLFQACPELVSGYWAHSALSIEPRLHARWMATMAYVGHIISLPPPSLQTFRLPTPRGTDPESVPFRPLPPALDSIIESILPSPLTKQHMTKGLQHADHLVQYMTAVTIARCLQKLSIVQALLLHIEGEVQAQPSSSDENPWTRRRRELEAECRRRLPEILVVISFAQKSATLAPADEDIDPATPAKSAMLTESALRLFRLYHSTLPAVGQDAKFDVGRLLVSSSSVKQERRERKEAKANAGSVIDNETRSVVSVGTMGTAGMGGGFGYAKGDVSGFEALSQVHVLHLLGAVQGWQWTNKASSSQYTYFYHILQLHLASTNPTTTAHSTALLKTLLLGTPLYDHDQAELDCFLSCLPHLPAESGAQGIVQQVHFLSFIDDCVRRCTKLPYRYIDEVLALVPDYFLAGEEWSLPSPLLMAVLEQWVAKVGGQHISSEAAGVVARVIRRLMLGILGKMRDTRWVEAYVSKMEAVLSKLRAEGKEKEGLEGVVSEIRGDTERVKGSAAEEVKEGLLAELLDEAAWREHSFEWRLLGSNLAPSKEEILAVSPGTCARYARFTALLLPARPDRSELLELIQTALSGLSGALGRRTKDAIFSGAWLQQAYLNAADNSCRPQLDNLSSVLDHTNPDQKSIAEPYILELTKAILSDKKGKHIQDALYLLHPWTRFVQPEQARAVLVKIGSHRDRLTGTRKGKAVEISDRVKRTIGDFALQGKDAGAALEHFDLFLDLGVLGPLVRLVTSSRLERQATNISPDIPTSTVSRLLAAGDSESSELLAELVLAYPTVAANTANALSSAAELNYARILPVAAALLGLPCASSLPDDLAATAASALEDQSSAVTLSIQQAAIRVLVHLSQQDAVLVSAALGEIRSFGRSTAELLRELSGIPDLRFGGLIALALRYAVEVCASPTPLSTDQEAILSIISEGMARGEEKDLDVLLVEPVMTAIMQERLTEEVPMQLANALVKRCELRASFIRQHLQFLLSSPLHLTLSGPSSAASDRLPFVRLYSALFHASTYTSCQPNFIEPLLALYRGTLSLSDRLVLGMLRTFETVRHISTSSILTHWSASGSPSNRCLDAITSLDAAKVLATCTAFPLRRTLAGTQEELDVDEKTYDPVFVLSLLAAMLQDDLTGLDWVEVLRSNVLGLAVCALASRDAGMRDIAGYCLDKTISTISDKPFHERDQLLHTLLLLQHALTPHPLYPGVTPRLPTLSTLFLAHALHAQSQPSHFLYPMTSRFLLQRPVFDPWDVPMLYTLLLGDRSERRTEMSSMAEVKRDRGWIVRLIRDATRSEADWTLLRRRNTWVYLADMYTISLDIPFRRLILQAMDSMTKVPQAARSLTHKYNLIAWCTSQFQMSILRPARNAAEERGRLVGLVLGCVAGCVAGEAEKQKAGAALSVPNGEAKVVLNGHAQAAGQSDASDSDSSTTSGSDSDSGSDSGSVASAADPKSKHANSKLGAGTAKSGSGSSALFNALRQSTERDGWLIRTERFVSLAAETADLARLVPLSKIALLVSSISPTSAAALLPPLVDRLAHLCPKPGADGASSQSDAEVVTANLFRAGLGMALGKGLIKAEMGVEPERVKRAVEELGWRAGLGAGEVGEWVRREKRIWDWDVVSNLRSN